MSFFTVISFLPPLTIDYLHFSISRLLWKWPTWLPTPYSTDQAEQNWPPPGFYSEGGGNEVRFTGVKRDREEQAVTRLYPTCPLAVCLSGRLEVKSFFFWTCENFATA